MSALAIEPTAAPAGVVVREDEPLARHTAWRTGGPCGAWIVVHRRAALPDAVAWAKERFLTVHVLGAGTRTLARDAGVAGAVLRLGTDFSGIDGTWVGAATPVPALVAACAAAGLSGTERFASVPGSVGASLLHDDWNDVVESVVALVRGRERELTLAEAQALKAPLLVGARLRLRPDGGVAARVAARRARTPASSWWKAPKRAALRDVLEAAGLGGVRLRDVRIPALAPELLVNTGGATARDLALLHASATERVVRETGVDLAPNVLFLGRA